MNKNTSNTQQAFWVALASLFSFGFGIVSSMVLSRYFPKADYGTYKQVLYVYSSLLVIFTLGLPKAYSFFLPRVEIDQAKDVIKKITCIFYALGAIFSAILYLLSDSIASLLRNEDLALALKIFSPVPFFLLPTMGIEGILATFKMTRFIAVYTVLTRIGMLLSIVLPVMLFNATYIGALIGFTVSSFFTFLAALYFKNLPVKGKANNKSNLKTHEILSFALPLLVASIWGIIERSADQFFVSRYYGAEKFAEFSNGAMELPFIGMIMSATAAVLSPVFSKMSYQKIDMKKELYPLWVRVFEKTSMLTYPLLIFALIYAEEIMICLYGEAYVGSAIYFQIFNLYLFFQIIIYGPYLINTGRQRLYASAHMYSVIVLIPVQITVLYVIDSPVALVAVTVVIKIARTLFFMRVISKDFNVSVWRLFPVKLLLKIMIPAATLAYIIKQILIIQLGMGALAGLVSGLFLYILMFSTYAVIFRIDYLSIITPLLHKRLQKWK